MKNIGLLGATGSIGLQTLDVIRQHPEQFSLSCFSFGNNKDSAIQIIQEFQPKLVSCGKKEDAESLCQQFSSNIRFVYGEEGLIEVATFHEIELLVTAIMGSVGLKPTLRAIEAGKHIGLANKETLVTAGHLVMEAAKKSNICILPVDSEHSAIFQCLRGERLAEVEKLILTASGGSFRDLTRDDLKNVTLEQALNHPNWSMGAKITIDSATMLNKGLEVIEAHWLFEMPYDQIEVLLHKESIIHSMVQFKDSSVMAQLGNPDMRVPIQLAMTYPERLDLNTNRLNLAEIGTLNFSAVDFERYPMLKYAFEAGRMGGTMPTVLNAANEVAVDAFLHKKISFLDIERCVYQALEKHRAINSPALEILEEEDRLTRQYVYQLIH